MNGFKICRKIKGANNAADLYLSLSGNLRRTVYDLFLNTFAGRHNGEIYLQAQKLLSLSECIFKKITNKGMLDNNSDQSNTVEQKYELL